MRVLGPDAIICHRREFEILSGQDDWYFHADLMR